MHYSVARTNPLSMNLRQNAWLCGNAETLEKPKFYYVCTYFKRDKKSDSNRHLIWRKCCSNVICKMVKSTSTPQPQEYKPVENDAPINSELCLKYQTIIRSLLYLMLGTHPDIAYAITKLAQFPTDPLQEHLDKTLSIC